MGNTKPFNLLGHVGSRYKHLMNRRCLESQLISLYSGSKGASGAEGGPTAKNGVCHGFRVV